MGTVSVEQMRKNQILNWLKNGDITLQDLCEMWSVTHESFLGEVIAEIIETENS